MSWRFADDDVRHHDHDLHNHDLDDFDDPDIDPDDLDDRDAFLLNRYRMQQSAGTFLQAQLPQGDRRGTCPPTSWRVNAGTRILSSRKR